jgi:hypothetical protein
MFRHTFARFTVLLLGVWLLSACGTAAAAPTPTPTKTPIPEQVAVVETPTNTPIPATATAIPEPPTATPTLPPSNLAPFSGLPVDDPAILKRHPIFICVNNDAVGRSQHYGLSLADLVYEYIVDGFTLTRMTAMYQSNSPERVGPVRSARYPNIWLLHMYDGVLACSGGSDAIRYLLKNEVGFPYLDADIDDPSNNRYFQSIGSDYRTRMQASPDGVRRWLADKAAACQANPGDLYCQKVMQNWLSDTWQIKEWNRAGFQFSETAPPNAAGSASVINIPYPGGNSVEWRYDANAGGYIRFQGGQQQFDLATGQPILAKNVIVPAAAHELTDIVEDSLGTKGVNIQLYGFGDLRVFRDGQVYEGTWRADDQNPPRWIGPGEVVIPLKPGQSWVQVVQQIPDISYQ